jgi:capsular polysaccharide biosynthesis protein
MTTADSRTLPSGRPGENDTLHVWRAISRNRWLVLAVVALTAAALAWALVVRPETYEVRSSLLLVPPPPAPTAAQVEENPELSGLNADNPYGRSYDPTILIAVITSAVTSEASREVFAAAGSDDAFTVAQSTRYGADSPFLEITSSGPSPEDALESNALVVEALQAELQRVQEVENVSERYFVTARPAATPTLDDARQVDVSRQVVALVVVGVFLIFAVVSVGDAVRQARADRAASRRIPEPR